jgi:hypothetical protein
MNDVAMSLLRFVLWGILLFGPLLLFLFVQHRLPSLAMRLGLALVFALITGFAAWAVASSIGLAVHVRAARVAVPPAAAGPVLFGFTLVLLAIFAMRSPAHARTLPQRATSPSATQPRTPSASTTHLQTTSNSASQLQATSSSAAQTRATSAAVQDGSRLERTSQ